MKRIDDWDRGLSIAKIILLLMVICFAIVSMSQMMVIILDNGFRENGMLTN